MTHVRFSRCKLVVVSEVILENSDFSIIAHPIKLCNMFFSMCFPAEERMPFPLPDIKYITDKGDTSKPISGKNKEKSAPHQQGAPLSI